MIAGIEVGTASPVRIMAVLNVSPESFYEGSIHAVADSLAAAARAFAEEGADFIDIGAMSTAPYRRTEVSAAEELSRMVRAVEIVAASVDIPISADTSRPEVARAALAAGARIVNDVGGLRVPGMGSAAAAADGVVLMAAPGANDGQVAHSPIERVATDLRAALARAGEAGVPADRIVVDPGIGFYTESKWPAAEFSCAVLRELGQLLNLGFPVLVGVSRKSFIGAASGRSDPAQRLAGSLAATAVAVWNGVSIVRTHDVAATRDAVRVVRAVMAGGT